MENTYQSPPRLQGAAPLPAAISQPPGRRIDPVGSLKKHWLLALGLLMLVLLAGLPVAWIKGAPKYSAAASIFVSPRFIANLQDDKEFELQSNSQYREYVQQTVRTINRFDIILDAVTNLGPNRADWVQLGESVNHAAGRLQAALDVQPVEGTYQILVSLDGDKAEGLARVVNTVVDTFLKQSKSEELFGTDARVQNLKEDRATLMREIEANQAKRARIAQAIGVSTFNDGFPNPYDKLLVDAKTAAAEARRARIYAEAQLQVVGPQHPGALDSYALDSSRKDPSVATLEDHLNQRRSVLLSMLSGLGPDHPGRPAIEQELAQLDSESRGKYQGLLNSYSDSILKQRQADAFRAQRVEKRVQDEVNSQASQATAFSTQYQQATALGQEIDRARKRLDRIEDRISFLSLESHAPGFIRLFSPARTINEPVKGGRKKLFVLVALAALLLALTAPTGVDLMDPRIQWPGDVQRTLGFPVTGWVMEKNEAGQAFNREQTLRLASRIAQERETHGSRIFAFTAVSPGAGTTTLVMELGHALTLLGMSTLAIEANAYRSDARYRGTNSGGLTVLLRGERSPATEIVPGDSYLPDHIPVGDAENLKNLPDLRNLLAVMQQAQEIYSVILIDLPPILASVDAEIVARNSDVVMIVIEAAKSTKDTVRNAARQIERLNPKAVSAVLNRVRACAARGFGREARDEYLSGKPANGLAWYFRWLWK